MAQTDWFAANAPKNPVPSPAAPQQAGQSKDWFSANAPKSSPASSAPVDDLAPPTLHDLASSNEKNEGLYKMKDATGHIYGIPYSAVEAADNWRDSFTDEKEAQRYEKDRKAQHPGLWAKARTKVYDLTEPTTTTSGKKMTMSIHDPVTIETANNALKRTGRTLFGIADMGPQLYHTLQKMASDDPKVSEEGEAELNNFHPGSQIAERMKEFKHDYKKDPKLAFANTAGDALAFYVADKMGDAAKEVPKTPENIGSSLRNRAGTGVKSTEKLVRDTALKNDELIANAKTEGEKAHAVKVKEVRDANEAATKEHEQALKDRNALEEKRVEASRKAAEARTRLHNHIQDIHDSATKYFDSQYQRLGEMTNGVKVDMSPLVEAVEAGKLQDIAGSQTGVPIFEDVIRRARGEQGAGGEKPSNWREMAPDEQEAWAKENSNDKGISYKDLTGYWRELGKIVKSPGAMDDIRTAAVKVRGVIENMQQEAAKAADAQAAEKALREHKAKPPSAAQLNYSLAQKYRNFAESYRDAGSVGTKAVKADNAVEATKPFIKAGTAEELSDLKRQVVGREDVTEGRRTNATEWAGRNSASDTAGKRMTRAQRRAQTEKLIDQTRKAHEDLANLGDVPERVEPPTLKDEPEYTPPAEETLNEEDLKLHKRKQFNEYLDSLEKNGVRLTLKGAGLLGSVGIVAHLLGLSAGAEGELVAGMVGATYLAPKVIARIIKSPGVAEWLQRITKADTDALAKLPANQRVGVENTIIQLTQAAKLKGILKQDDPTPLARYAKQDLPKAKAEMAEQKAKASEEPKPEPPPEEPPPAPAPKPSDPSNPALPGMEGAVAEQETAAGEHKTAEQKQAVETSLTTPKDDISKATGEMERNSTLFRDSEASGQGGLFNQPEAEPRNNVQPSRRLEDLKVDPKRFQYKLGGNKAGVTDALSDAKWDQDLADPIHIWEDPETGEEFVVNGHHRYDLAKQAGAERIDINKIDNKKWPTAADARRFGALKNIADGNGTSVDAAKFLREKGYTPEEFKATGLSLKKSVASEGVALAKLSDDIFDRVVDGRVEPKIGAAIGEASENPVDQEAILKDVNRREKQGRPVSAEQIKESARLIKQSPTYTSQTEDLFGNHEEERNLFLEMGEVSEYIQKELADEKRIFNRVATKGASEQLAKGKNVINPEENAKIAQRAAQLRELYMKRSAQAGPIHSALQEAAERLAEGGKANAIKQSALDEIREHLDDELGTPE
jgi:hypothetical protein